jgi:hypothetical protein
MRLGEAARLVRSKNAGPFWLTFDVIFDDPALYARAVASGGFTAERLGPLFGRRPEEVAVFAVDSACAFKLSFRRPHSSGSAHDGDVFGGQQYAPLLELEL